MNAEGITIPFVTNHVHSGERVMFRRLLSPAGVAAMAAVVGLPTGTALAAPPNPAAVRPGGAPPAGPGMGRPVGARPIAQGMAPGPRPGPVPAGAPVGARPFTPGIARPVGAQPVAPGVAQIGRYPYHGYAGVRPGASFAPYHSYGHYGYPYRYNYGYPRSSFALSIGLGSLLYPG